MKSKNKLHKIFSRTIALALPLAAAFASVLALVWFAAFRRRRRLAEGAPYPKGEGGVPC